MLPLVDFAYNLIAGIVTLFVILDPIGVVPFFQTLTAGVAPVQRHKVAKRSITITMVLLLVFAYVGKGLLALLGITIYHFEIAGGTLLFVFAIRDALSSEPLGASESLAAAGKSEKVFDRIAVIPLATPLLAGPGSLTTAILLTNLDFGYIIAGIAIIVDCLIALVTFRASDRLNAMIGPSGLLIIGKVLDIVMAAIAVSYLVRGITGVGF